MPKLRRIKFGSLNNPFICRVSAIDSRLRLMEAALGTKKKATKTPITPSNAVAQKTPESPKLAVKTGPSIIASIKEKPMLPPIAAMALERFCSTVKSATKAINVLAIAPVPCKARPTTNPAIVSASAATTLPAININKPPIITGWRPIRSERRPRGICSIA